jgi:PPK2 family polyphosphate:nucleotide phosphotransferase
VANGKNDGKGDAKGDGKSDAKRPESLPGKLCVAPGAQVKLRDEDADRDHGWDEAAARAQTAKLREELSDLQYKLYADGRFALLVVLQAIDGGGKDSTTRHVISAFNPQGCAVTSFKAPSAEELRHDYLWRVHRHAPAKGEVAVFNRSHYEDVLVVRVDELVPREVWSARYEQINQFEKLLHAADTRVVKIFLHISRDEQKRRFQERLDEPAKQWKFDPADLKKRAQWKDYMAAFEDMLEKCSTEHAPWYIVPGDHKWLRDLAVAQILKEALTALPLRFPKPAYDPKSIRID